MDSSPVEFSTKNAPNTCSGSEFENIDYSFLTAYDTQTILSMILKILVENSKIDSLPVVRGDFVSLLKQELANKQGVNCEES